MVCMFQKQLPVFQLLLSWWSCDSLSLSPPRLLRPVPEPLLWLQAQVTRLRRAGTRQAFMIHLENTSPPRLSAGKPSSSFLSFRQPSITGKHQMGWIEAILQKVLRDWLPQWSFQLETERPESTAFSAQFHRLKNYRWLPRAPEVCAAFLDRIRCKLQKLFCLFIVQLRPQFLSALRVRVEDAE